MSALRINDLAPESPDTPATIHVPARPSESTVDTQSRMRSEFLHWFSKNYAATSVRFTPSGADYLLRPWSDF